jgi:hypothetical protein
MFRPRLLDEVGLIFFDAEFIPAATLTLKFD